MNADRLLSVLPILLLSLVLVSGCGKGGGEEKTAPASGVASTLRDMGSAPAAAAISEPMRPFFAAGLGFIVLGGAAMCLGGRKTGATLLFFGVLTTATGVLFVQYPWAVLCVALAAGLLAIAAVYDRFRTRRELERDREALAITTEVIQNCPEGGAIKQGISGLGRDWEEKVRQAVRPIKERLRREGRI